MDLTLFLWVSSNTSAFDLYKQEQLSVVVEIRQIEGRRLEKNVIIIFIIIIIYNDNNNNVDICKHPFLLLFDSLKNNRK